MLKEIELLLNDISNCPNIYISQNSEYVLEPMKESDIKDYVKYIKFSIIKRGSIYSDNVIYTASAKENNPEEYLKTIIDDLKIIRQKYLKIAN